VLLITLVSAGAAPVADRSYPAPLATRSLLLDVTAVGDRLVAVGERGIVLVSRNAGSTWTQIQVPTRVMLTAVAFMNERIGFAVGHDAVILRTQDGGETWERVHYAPDQQRPLFDVMITGAQHAVAVGAYGYYLETNNGGINWTERKFRAATETTKSDADAATRSGSADNVPDDLHLNAIFAAGPQRWFIAAEAGTIYRSDDSGQSWFRLGSPYEGSFYGVISLNIDIVLVYGLQGRIYRSENGGKNWERIETGTPAVLMGGLRLKDGRIVVTGATGTLLVSTDNGRSFKTRPQTDRRAIAGAIETSDGSLVIVGEAGVRRLPRTALDGS